MKKIPNNTKIVQENNFNPPESCNKDDLPEGVPKKLVLKNSFGFGGTNISLLFGEVSDD